MSAATDGTPTTNSGMSGTTDENPANNARMSTTADGTTTAPSLGQATETEEESLTRETYEIRTIQGEDYEKTSSAGQKWADLGIGEITVDLSGGRVALAQNSRRRGRDETVHEERHP